MLDTKPQTARHTAHSRSFSSRLSPGPSGASTAHALPPREPMPDQGRRQAEREARRAALGRPRGSRVSRSEARLLTWTVTSAIVVCGLLVLYLAAYAHLTMLGIEQSKAQHALREKWQQNQMLRAQEAALKNPDRIAARAVRLGLTKDSSRVDYIRPTSAIAGLPVVSAPILLEGAANTGTFSDDGVTDGGGKAGSWGTNSGPKTEDNFTARND